MALRPPLRRRGPDRHRAGPARGRLAREHRPLRGARGRRGRARRCAALRASSARASRTYPTRGSRSTSPTSPSTRACCARSPPRCRPAAGSRSAPRRPRSRIACSPPSCRPRGGPPRRGDAPGQPAPLAARRRAARRRRRARPARQGRLRRARDALPVGRADRRGVRRARPPARTPAAPASRSPRTTPRCATGCCRPPGARCELLLGVRPADALALAAAGRDVRVYVPFGEQWFRYFMRRRAESQGA